MATIANKNINKKFKKGVFRAVESLERIKAPVQKKNDGFVNIESEDGTMRYKFGVIDFLTEYSSIKLLENEMKSKLHGVDQLEVSAIDQQRYFERFNKYFEDYL